MLVSEFSTSPENVSKRRINFHKRKLEMLKFYKDSLERRIASVSASIEVIEQQINRDNINS